MSASMAEVLAEHHILYAYIPAMLENQWTCTSRGCDFRTVNFADAIAHQAEQLAANGYGKLEDAWSEGASFGGLYDHVFYNDNPYRRPE